MICKLICKLISSVKKCRKVQRSTHLYTLPSDTCLHFHTLFYTSLREEFLQICQSVRPLRQKGSCPCKKGCLPRGICFLLGGKTYWNLHCVGQWILQNGLTFNLILCKITHYKLVSQKSTWVKWVNFCSATIVSKLHL